MLRNVVINTSALEAGIHTKTPQCGMNPTTTVAPRTFQYVPPWVYVGLLANVVLLAILDYAGRRVVKGQLHLCDDCDADRRARTLQSVSVGGLIGFPLVLGGIAAVLEQIGGTGRLFK